MNSNQKTLAIVVVAAVSLLLLATLSIVYWQMFGSAHIAAANNSPAATQPDAADPDPASVEAHLSNVADDLAKAIDDMSRATIAGKGGYTEKSRADTPPFVAIPLWKGISPAWISASGENV